MYKGWPCVKNELKFKKVSLSENEKFESRNSVRTHRSVRKALRDIRTFAKMRADEIHYKHQTTRITHKGDEKN